MKRGFLLIVMACLAGSRALAAGPDNGIYARLLSENVRDGFVDYAGFKKNEASLDRYLDLLAKVDRKSLSRDEDFAFLVNAYNAWTIKLILTGYPGVASIKDLGGWFSGPWKKKFVRLGEGTVSLDWIEHEELRPKYRDPRVHFAVNCASRSCPALLEEPYEAETLNEQLDAQARRFLNNPQKNRLEENTLFASAIFKWFKEDFGGDPLPLFIRYADAPLRENLLKNKDGLRIGYLDYDWSLNGK